MISIILPVYNSAPFVDQAIQSVLNQSLKDWELIIVDDNSSDETFEIITKYEYDYNNIIIWKNEENLGVSESRNIGLKLSKGKYISFLDADDTFEPSFLEIMLSTAEKNSAEIVWCNYKIKNSKNDVGLFVSNQLSKNNIYGSKYAVDFFFKNIPGTASLWNKIYLKIFLEKINIKFNLLRKKAGDWEFNLFAFSKVDRLILVEDYLYNYTNQNKYSIMSTFRLNDLNMMWRSIELLERVNNQFKLGYSLKDIYNINPSPMVELFFKSSNSINYKITKQYFKKIGFKHYINLIDIKKLPKTYQIICTLLKINFWNTAIFFSRAVHTYHNLLKS